MGKVFNRLANQVQSRRKGLQAGRPSVVSIINVLIAHQLEVDSLLRDMLPTEPENVEPQHEDFIAASLELREKVKLWLA